MGGHSGPWRQFGSGAISRWAGGLLLRCACCVTVRGLAFFKFSHHTEGESLSAEDIALPTATEGREPGLASMGTIWTWRRWTSSLPTLLPSLRGWMVDAQQYHVPRGVCKKSIIPAAHRVHSDQSLSSLEDVWHTQGAGI